MPDFDQDLERIQSALASRDTDVIELGLDEVATRYATECREMNQRLHHCAKLLKKGLLAEAIQQAQLAPALLDQFAMLDFPERDEWASYVTENSLAVPPPLQTKLAIELNQAFAEAETMKECLSRHRSLALARAPIRRRLSVMWRLAKLDPMNPVWMKDLRQFERVRIREIENEIHEATRNDDCDRVELLFKEVTYPHWTEPPPPSLINQVKSAWSKYATREARSDLAELEAKLTAAVMAGNKVQAKAYYDRAVRLKKEAGLPASHPLRQRLDLALEWVEEQEQRDVRRQEWQDDCEQLANSLHAGKPAPELARLKEQVLAYGMGIPEDLDGWFDQLARKRRRRKILIWLVILLIAPSPLLCVAIPVVYRYYFPSSNPNGPIEKKDGAQKPLTKDTPKSDKDDALKAEVRAIIRDNCFRCHGGEKKNRIDDILDHSLLTTKASKSQLTKGKKYVVPTRPEESAIWLRIAMDDPEDRMPPKDEKEKLTDDQKRKVKNWITSGAPPF